MPAPITVVIPTLNAQSDLSDTLAALLEGIAAGLIRELVIADGGSQDQTLRIADAAGAHVVTTAPGRGLQLRAGTEAASAEWLLLLHADTWLDPGWTEAVQAHLSTGGEQAGYFQLRFRAKGGWPSLVAAWANMRSRLFGLPYGDQGLLVRRTLLNEVGGVPPLPLMEDVALARSLRGRLVELPCRAATSAARYQSEGWGRRGARNLWTLARYTMGADPADLARSYAPSSRN